MLKYQNQHTISKQIKQSYISWLRNTEEVTHFGFGISRRKKKNGIDASLMIINQLFS